MQDPNQSWSEQDEARIENVEELGQDFTIGSQHHVDQASNNGSENERVKHPLNTKLSQLKLNTLRTVFPWRHL